MTNPWPNGMPLSSAYPGRSGGARLGHRHHQVGLDRELARQPPAHLDPGLVHALAADRGVRTRQVDVLEDTALAGRLGEPVGPQAVLVDGHELAGLDLADQAGADGGQGRVLGGDHPAPVQPAQDQRPDALGVAGGVERVRVHPHEREGAVQHRQHLERALLQRGVRVVGQQRRDQAGVVGGGLDVPGVQGQLTLRVRQLLDELSQLVGVDQVAVVAERDRPVGGRAEGRLGVVPGAGAGRGVAAVADRQVALERVERRLVEDLGHQSHVLVDQDLPAVADRDAGRLLPAVLQGVEAEVGELGDVLAGGPDAEDAARVLGAAILRVEVVVEPTVAPTPPRSWMAAGAEVGHALIVGAEEVGICIAGRSRARASTSASWA